MLYAVRYEKAFVNKREEHLYQKALSRRLLSHGLQREYGIALEGLALSYGPQGKPYFQDFPVKFSLSHCRGLVCCALSGQEIGVDCEPIRPFDPRLANRICTPAELAWLDAAPDRGRALTVLWTLKESLMKLSGEGFRYGFQNASFSFIEGRPVPPEPEVRAAAYHLPGFQVSLCCLEAPPQEPILLSLEQLL